jgi:hypothetical protein
MIRTTRAPSSVPSSAPGIFPGIRSGILLFSCFAFLACILPAQQTITLRMLDSKTGHLIATTDYLIRINHKQDVHANWVTQNENGSGHLTLPPEATEISVHATYDSTMSNFMNCDADKNKGSAESAAGTDLWYPVADILAKGVLAPNGCVGKKVPERLQVSAKPGEFVFFVRKMSYLEQYEK